jgi:hypothetical protein
MRHQRPLRSFAIPKMVSSTASSSRARRACRRRGRCDMWFRLPLRARRTARALSIRVPIAGWQDGVELPGSRASLATLGGEVREWVEGRRKSHGHTAGGQPALVRPTSRGRAPRRPLLPLGFTPHSRSDRASSGGPIAFGGSAAGAGSPHTPPAVVSGDTFGRAGPATPHVHSRAKRSGEGSRLNLLGPGRQGRRRVRLRALRGWRDSRRASTEGDAQDQETPTSAPLHRQRGAVKYKHRARRCHAFKDSRKRFTDSGATRTPDPWPTLRARCLSSHSRSRPSKRKSPEGPGCRCRM